MDTKMSAVDRISSLSREQRRLLLRSLVLLTAASATVALLPFRYAIRFGAVALDKPRPLEVVQCIWAVETAARRLPFRTLCIEKGLAAQRMLRSAGIDAALHYGARHNPQSRELQAHVWVTVDERVVLGLGAMSGFAALAKIP